MMGLLIGGAAMLVVLLPLGMVAVTRVRYPRTRRLTAAEARALQDELNRRHLQVLATRAERR